MDALKEDKIVAIRRSSTSLSKLKNSTNKLLLKLVKGLPLIPRPSGTWTKSFLMGLKRDNTSIIFSKLITLMSAPQPSIDISEKDTYLSLLLTQPEPLNSKKDGKVNYLPSLKKLKKAVPMRISKTIQSLINQTLGWKWTPLWAGWEGKYYSPSIYLSVTLSLLDFWGIKLPLRLPNTSMPSRTLFMKLIKISSNSFLSFLPIMVESLPGLMISKWMCEERVNSSFVILIALTRKGELRKITR